MAGESVGSSSRLLSGAASAGVLAKDRLTGRESALGISSSLTGVAAAGIRAGLAAKERGASGAGSIAGGASARAGDDAL